ncbi:Oidioi.mRNA.OKI2018_I69.PAR.g11950.t1.cds [Oikopleura dioica]|uniref:Oidioi.mRNA.OKI2018_I69.PAR.g11950.t1.cds n=1 Tax=Oikopleura dioica TaxID=34765 RepID=A0ABN7S3M5_OIKDI|nr:Oidioi.mRNA.OKI2018_I69.PAR.g11950.t1.cds [Oikopleura dioica]
MTSTEGLYIRHSDMQPGFYQANGFWMLPALFLLICISVFAVIRIWTYLYEYYMNKRSRRTRNPAERWSLHSPSPNI